VLEKTGKGIDAVISLVADTEILVARLLKRAELEGRADDNAETIRNRMVIYTDATDPLLATYRDRGLLVEVDGIGAIDEVAGRITSALDAKLG
jgi:adenylate kinase